MVSSSIRLRWIAAAAAIVAASLWACGEQKAGDSGGAEPIRVGHVASLTGDTASITALPEKKGTLTRP